MEKITRNDCRIQEARKKGTLVTMGACKIDKLLTKKELECEAHCIGYNSGSLGWNYDAWYLLHNNVTYLVLTGYRPTYRDSNKAVADELIKLNKSL